MSSATALDDLLAEIEGALDAKLWFLALTGSLTIPDVCGALKSSDGKTTAALYKSWFETHVAPKYVRGPGQPPIFTGLDCWRYRCAVLHEGTSHPSGSQYTRVVFVDPDNSNFFHCNVFNDVLNLDLRTFCLDLVASARAWQIRASQTPNYRANNARLFRRHPDGIEPLFVGVALYG